MSKHRVVPSTIPSSATVAQPIPLNYPQTHWFGETERLRPAHRDPQPEKLPKYIAVPDSDIAMSFVEIAKIIGTTPQGAQYIFYRGMSKLMRMRESKALRDLHGLAQLRQSLFRGVEE